MVSIQGGRVLENWLIHRRLEIASLLSIGFGKILHNRSLKEIRNSKELSVKIISDTH
jgi:hypothetical protein